jgi:xanthine dehydrogenase accessory factor
VKNFFAEIAELLATGESVAVATIARGRGSAPRSRGTRCGVRADGSVVGTIGGGLLEARTQQIGREALVEQRVRLLELRLDSQDLAASGMVCGGSVDIVVAPWSAEQGVLAREAARSLDGDGPAALALHWSAGGGRWRQDLFRGGAWLHGGLDSPAVPDLLREAQDTQQVTMAGDARQGWVVDPLPRQREPLLIFGGGHVGRALARVASTADFSVTVVDDRAEFAAAEHIPWADRTLCHPFPGAVEALAPGKGDFIVICTRGHSLDTLCAAEALRSRAPYVGVIGSRRKRDLLLRHLREEGIPEERLQALRMPVGLPIGAETPEEIAISMLAELIQVRRGGAPPA